MERYYKVLKKELKHYGFQYKLGLNIDHMPFNPNGSCEAGGLYYTTKEHLYKFLGYGCYIADVSIPEDAKIYKDPEGKKWKANKIIIERITWIGDHELWNDEEFLLTIVVSTYDYTCKNHYGQTLLNKITRSPLSIMFVKKQSKEVCLAAVKQNGYALKYIKDQTKDVCVEAVKKDGWAIVYIKEQTEEICLAAVKQNGLALAYVKEQTEEICLAAVKQNGLALAYVKEQTLEICIEAVKQDGSVLQYVKEQTKEICEEAVKKNAYAKKYVNVSF